MLLFVANDFRRKGLDTLLEALAAFNHVHLMVIGHSAQVPEYQTRCRTLAVDGRVHFLGRQADMHPVYAAADMLIHPTREDTFGMVVLEAMAQGLPVVVSRAPYCGLSADLGADEAVLLQDPESVEELSAALHVLLDNDARRAAFAQAGRAVAARYDWAQVAQAYERLYFELLAA
jgi:UDP-glucose:(heptosyl)LPS alpha-1,3-glucosyltransferase